MLVVCAWCPESPKEQEAVLMGVEVSHGICERHHDELMKWIQEGQRGTYRGDRAA